MKAYDGAAAARFNIWVNTEGPELATTDVSAHITSDRADHRRAGDVSRRRRDGCSAPATRARAIPAPATRWFLAEGATGAVLRSVRADRQSRTTSRRTSTATYLLPDGATVIKELHGRAEQPLQHLGRRGAVPEDRAALLADTAVSTIVTSTNGVPMVVERAMWWPGPARHVARGPQLAGATTTGTRWALAEGEVGGANATETYILIANTSASGGRRG